MRGRGLMLVAGMKIGQNQAKQAAAMKQQGAEEAKVQAAKAAAAPTAPAPAATGPGMDVTAQLQKLADLHTSGLLSDEEFSAAKKKLLGV